MFLHKILQLGKLKSIDLKHENSIFKTLAQKYPNKPFLVPNLGILFFHKILQLDKFESADFKYEYSIFQILAQNYANKEFLIKNTQITYFWSQILAFLFLHKILQLDKLKSMDLKHDNSFFKTVAQKYPNKPFLVANLGIFVFSQNLAIRKIWKCSFQISK